MDSADCCVEIVHRRYCFAATAAVQAFSAARLAANAVILSLSKDL
jgi:hypothetical protein